MSYFPQKDRWTHFHFSSDRVQSFKSIITAGSTPNDKAVDSLLVLTLEKEKIQTEFFLEKSPLVSSDIIMHLKLWSKYFQSRHLLDLCLQLEVRAGVHWAGVHWDGSFKMSNYFMSDCVEIWYPMVFKNSNGIPFNSAVLCVHVNN